MSEPPVPRTTLPDGTAAGTADGTTGGKPKRRMTARWRYTNRINARASTGPRTAAGKARVARNALRHGLSLPVPSDLGFAPEIVELAHRIEQSVFGRNLEGVRHELACRIAETLIDLRRIRLAKHPLFAAFEADLANGDKPLVRLVRLGRYEARAQSRRRQAVRDFYEAVTGMPIPKPPWPTWQNKGIMHLTYSCSKPTDAKPASANANQAGAPDEVTMDMLDAGALALSRIKDDLAEGGLGLREGAQLVFQAMRRASSSGQSSPISHVRSRRLLPASVWRKMFLTRSRLDLAR